MMNAYKQGIPGNGSSFAEGMRPMGPKKNRRSMYHVEVVDTLKLVPRR